MNKNNNPIPETTPEPVPITNQEEARQKLLDKKATYDAVEHESAQLFLSKLQELLPQLLQCFTVNEVDQLLLDFSTDLCQGNELLVFR